MSTTRKQNRIVVLLGRKGGLQIGLNAIVSFIISVMIFGFGIFLVTSFMEKAPLDFPDACVREINDNLRQNSIFTVCPSTITLSKSEMTRGFKVAYGYQNLDSDQKELFFHIKDPDDDSKFKNQESPVIVPAHNARQGMAIIGLKDPNDYDALDQTTYINVLLCTEPIPTNFDTSDGCISQERIISIRKR
jgi:hypothetical protein